MSAQLRTVLISIALCASVAVGQRGRSNSPGRIVQELTQIPGRPTDRSISLSVLAPNALEAYVEYGLKPGSYSGKTAAAKIPEKRPVEITLDSLQANTRYYYRLRYRESGQGRYAEGAQQTFHTQPPAGSTFAFGVQGDSHPERLNRMYHPDLYQRTMQQVRAHGLDFYFLLGDDFSTDHLHNSNSMTADAVGALYVNQRRFLSVSGTPLFLVNGNHEHAARYLLNGSPDSPAVLAGVARNLYFPLPAPDRFYSGNTSTVEFVGLPRDYYAFTWGDALFVALDPYWHSPVQIDSGLAGRQGGQRGGGRNRDGWATTMGDNQYQWLKRTLEQSRAKYKFVFAHHVNGTGRGAVEVADLYEWGGKGRNGQWEFDSKRPGWAMPVHQLMVKTGVTIFFQGHDHLFARQEKDGVIYQETPNPADTTYTAFNREAYLSGDILPNSGYLRVTVTPENAKVDYIRTWLNKDETAENKNGAVAFSYTVAPRRK
ncbi:MAG: metallophosphoesterase [Bryobacterales bacterium]|nr:metallophosphoesterase [Bryobacterales bacterium]